MHLAPCCSASSRAGSCSVPARQCCRSDARQGGSRRSENPQPCSHKPTGEISWLSNRKQRTIARSWSSGRAARDRSGAPAGCWARCLANRSLEMVMCESLQAGKVQGGTSEDENRVEPVKDHRVADALRSMLRSEQASAKRSCTNRSHVEIAFLRVGHCGRRNRGGEQMCKQTQSLPPEPRWKVQSPLTGSNLIKKPHERPARGRAEGWTGVRPEVVGEGPHAIHVAVAAAQVQPRLPFATTTHKLRPC